MEKVRLRNTDDLRCPYCHDDDFTSEPSLRCAGCRAWQHKVCYDDEKKCGGCGRLAEVKQETHYALIAENKRFVDDLVHLRGAAGQIDVSSIYGDQPGVRQLIEKLTIGGATCYYDRTNEVVLWAVPTAAARIHDGLREAAAGLRRVAEERDLGVSQAGADESQRRMLEMTIVCAIIIIAALVATAVGR